jgi:phospholipid/cholesterol/gamma-HCH transport system substrate-binding protein
MRSLQTANRRRTGLMGALIVALVVAVGQSFASVPMLFATPHYFAQFARAAGIRPADKIQIAGVNVGEVHSVELQGESVVIGFSLTHTPIGSDSRAVIRTDTILGRKNIEIEPRGSTALRPGAMLPQGQTTTPYQIYDAFNDVTKAAAGWDIDTVKQSLNVLSETINQTYPHLSAALDGVTRFADTIGKRDDAVKHLLANTNTIATVLGDRSDQIDRLLVNARGLLGAINERGKAITYLLERVNAFATQVPGFINDNPNLNRVLEQLRTITDTLAKRKNDLIDALTTLSKFAASLGEVIASGPYFKVMLANLVPPQILQPFIDSAFKKRGIDPEQFWRNAGLPAFRFPDPNGPRAANGAPPPAPTPLEGTPEHPGPAVPAGSPCSYTPPPDGLPTPADPLPCAHLDQGPFGPVPGGFSPPDVAVLQPNPDGPPPSAGVPAAAVPGEAPPNLPGIPTPLAPGPPGARTIPVGPPSAIGAFPDSPPPVPTATGGP